jgi:hypothetical protein
MARVELTITVVAAFAASGPEGVTHTVDMAVDIAVDNFVGRSRNGRSHEEIRPTRPDPELGTPRVHCLASAVVLHVKHSRSLSQWDLMV